MSSQVIDGWKPIHGVPGKTIVWQNSDGSYTVTIDPLAIGDGNGDMLKSVYDADGDNIVDLAESVPWSGVTDKPTTFPPSSHDHDDRYYTESETDSLLAGYVLKSTFDVNTILIANDDNTPMALSVPASTLIGRAASGGIAALTAGSARTVLGLATTDAPTFAGVVAPYIAPASDSTAAIQMLKANKSTVVVNVDTTNGYVGVGTAAPEAYIDARWPLLSHDASFRVTGGGAIVQNAGDHASDPASIFTLRRGRGSLASPTAINSGDTLGSFQFGGHDGTAWRSGWNGGVQMSVVATENWSSTARGARFVFRTSAVGSTSAADRLNINENGICVGATSVPTISDGVGVDVNGKILRLRSSKTPASATATGNVGEICWDSNYIYVAVGANSWKRAALSTW